MSAEDFDAIRLIEALLFASAEPLSEKALARHFGEGTDVAALLARLQKDYAGRGVNLLERDGAWAFRTAADLPRTARKAPNSWPRSRPSAASPPRAARWTC